MIDRAYNSSSVKMNFKVGIFLQNIHLEPIRTGVPATTYKLFFKSVCSMFIPIAMEPFL